MVTIKDIAKKAGVSISTVSYALNGIDKVSPETRDQILQIAKDLQYNKHGAASDLRRKETNKIVLIVEDLSGPFYSEVIRGVQDVVMSHKYDLVACNSLRGKESTAYKYLTERRSDGCIVFAHNITEEMIKMSGSGPIILIDKQIEADSVVSIMVDNKQGAFDATNYLIEQGHKKIAYVSGPQESLDNQLRYEGFRKALRENDVAFEPKWVVNGKFTTESGAHATNVLLAQEDLPTAIFYGNDEMALGGIKAIENHQLKIPDDLSIIGFDDIIEAKYVEPKLTTIRQPKYEMGSLAAHLLIRIINGEEVNNNYSLQTELIIRDSVL